MMLIGTENKLIDVMKRRDRTDQEKIVEVAKNETGKNKINGNKI